MAADTVPAAERAYAYTKDMIVRGELPGGTLLSEGRICEELGLSRTPVHEAFLRLATEQLLELSSRRGAVVRPMAPHEAEDVLELREAIETTAIARLLRTGGPGADALGAWRALLDEQRRHVAAGDIQAFVAADDALHTAIVAAAGNPIAAHVLGLLRDRQQRLRRQYLRIVPEHLELGLEDHVRLVDALAAGDGPAATAVLSDHLSRYRGAL